MDVWSHWTTPGRARERLLELCSLEEDFVFSHTPQTRLSSRLHSRRGRKPYNSPLSCLPGGSHFSNRRWNR
jgi:hypothetical protein